jgi:hypothetical protein
MPVRRAIPPAQKFGYHHACGEWMQSAGSVEHDVRPFLSVCAMLVFAGVAPPAAADGVWPAEATCYWCIRDAIYDNLKLIAHREANPDVDEAVKGPEIIAARADIHRLRKMLGPLQSDGTEPCCYSRRPLYVR